MYGSTQIVNLQKLCHFQTTVTRPATVQPYHNYMLHMSTYMYHCPHHATLTLFHTVVLISQIQLPPLRIPPTTKRRLPSSECVKEVAAWFHLGPGLSGPCGASFCQCCGKNSTICAFSMILLVVTQNKATSITIPISHWQNQIFHTPNYM